MKNKLSAHLGLLGTNLFFAINLSAAKYLTQNNWIKPYGLTLVRVAITAILFWLLFLAKPGKPGIARQDIGRFLLCGATGIAINQLLFLKGLSLTYSIHAGLLMFTTPILIIVLAAWLLHEKITWVKTVGLLLGVSGAIVLVTHKENTGSGTQVLLGDSLVIINAISYTIFFIAVKPLMERYHPVHVTRWVFTIGLVLVLPFGWTEFATAPWLSYTSKEVGLMASVVIAGTFLAYLFNVYGIKELGASVAGAYIYVQPVFAAAIAMLFLHEQLEIYKVIAGMLIFAGVYLANRKN